MTRRRIKDSELVQNKNQFLAALPIIAKPEFNEWAWQKYQEQMANSGPVSAGVIRLSMPLLETLFLLAPESYPSARS